MATKTYRVCSHGVDLGKIARLLNSRQKCFHFVNVRSRSERDPLFDQTGLTLKRHRKLINAELRDGAPKTDDERRKAVNSYIVTEDAVEQLLIGAASALASNQNTLLNKDLVIGIGSEVFVQDSHDNQFEGDAALDTAASDTVELPDDENNNNKSWPFMQGAVISLRRINFVFPEAASTDNHERAWAIVSRYIISNVVFLLGNKVFARWGWHHDLVGCLNESAWVGGEREGYHIDYYCLDCLKTYKEFGVADRYAGKCEANSLIQAIYSMLRVPDEIDRTVRSSQTFMFWIQFAGIAVATNIVAAQLMDLVSRFDWDAVGEKWPESNHRFWALHIHTHWFALIVACLALAIATSLLIIHYRRHARVP